MVLDLEARLWGFEGFWALGAKTTTKCSARAFSSFLQGLRVTLYAKAMFSGGFFFHLSVYWWIDSPVNTQFDTNPLHRKKSTTKAKRLPANLQAATLRMCSAIKSMRKNATKEKLLSRETNESQRKVEEEPKEKQKRNEPLKQNAEKT